MCPMRPAQPRAMLSVMRRYAVPRKLSPDRFTCEVINRKFAPAWHQEHSLVSLLVPSIGLRGVGGTAVARRYASTHVAIEVRASVAGQLPHRMSVGHPYGAGQITGNRLGREVVGRS